MVIVRAPVVSSLRKSEEANVIEGYIVPSAPAGKAEENFARPVFYAGDFLAIEFWASPGATAAALGPALTADQAACGHAWALFADWQVSTQDDELTDSPPDQYREFCVLVDAMWRDNPVLWRSHVYVDQASVMARGWVRGYPRKLGLLSQTRSFAMPGRASAALAAGTRMSGSLSVCGRAQAEASITLRDSMYDAPHVLRRPTVNLRYLPLFASESRNDRARVHELVTDVDQDVHFTNVWRGEAELHIPRSADKELDALAPMRVGKGYRWSMSCSVSDVRVLESFIEPT
jgi:acetoacetate decarboxylase